MKLHTVHYQRRDGDHPFGHSSCWYKFEAITVALTCFLHGLGAIMKRVINSSISRNQKEGMADNEPFFRSKESVIGMLFAVSYLRLSFVESNRTIHPILFNHARMLRYACDGHVTVHVSFWSQLPRYNKLSSRKQ